LSWDHQKSLIQKLYTQEQAPPYTIAALELEDSWRQKGLAEAPMPPEQGLTANPTLELFEGSWLGLAENFRRYLEQGDNYPPAPVKNGSAWALLWLDPHSGSARIREAGEEDLLLLKMVEEGIDPLDLWRQNGLKPALVDDIAQGLIQEGLLLRAPTRLVRDWQNVPAMHNYDQDMLQVNTFAIQWHITHTCDLHCKHCYDRSKRSNLTWEQGEQVLDDLYRFCRRNSVGGHITFTGGNPYLHRHFYDLYQGAVDRGFSVSILGNPVSRQKLAKTVAIARPEFYQVSLEGLEATNDGIRGSGNFQDVLAFLPMLAEFDIYSMVMLTMNRYNMGEVMDLVEFLDGKVDSFTFNRLSLVGEGANLLLPGKEDYEAFVRRYFDNLDRYEHARIKDNLFNILLDEKGLKLSDGCTGYGCGAAFNFVAILPDGETHACRKFPSYIGNVLQSSLAEIYNSPAAQSYRNGPAACASCPLRPACGGCMALTASAGLDPLVDTDPYCFYRGEGL
jgi:selenobiotic family peptide radical SAM maturase